jgi:hypothetical protein
MSELITFGQIADGVKMILLVAGCVWAVGSVIGLVQRIRRRRKARTSRLALLEIELANIRALARRTDATAFNRVGRTEFAQVVSRLWEMIDDLERDRDSLAVMLQDVRERIGELEAKSKRSGKRVAA